MSTLSDIQRQLQQQQTRKIQMAKRSECERKKNTERKRKNKIEKKRKKKSPEQTNALKTKQKMGKRTFSLLLISSIHSQYMNVSF